MTQNDAYVAVFCACIPVADAMRARQAAEGINPEPLAVITRDIAAEAFEQLEAAVPERGWKDGPQWTPERTT